MSLVAWYPLIKDTKNYSGISGLDPTESSPILEDANHTSPLGNSLYTGKLTLTGAQWAKILGNTTSIAMWIYLRADGTFSAGTPILGASGMTAPYNRKFTMFHYPTKTSLHCSWQNDSSDATYWSCRLDNFFEEGRWTHLVVVQDAANNKISIYRNGALKQTWTVNDLSTMSIKTFPDAPLRNNIDYQNICDIRFYNHALTAAEIKRIYQTLVVHLTPTSIHGAWNTNQLDQTTTPSHVGWGAGTKVWNENEKSWCLTPPRGWTYYYWAVPANVQGRTVVFSFDYKIVDGTNGNVLFVQDADTPAYGGTHIKYLSTGAEAATGWQHVNFRIDACGTYVGFNVRGFDTPVSDGAVFSVKFRNLCLRLEYSDWDTTYSDYNQDNVRNDYRNGGIIPDLVFSTTYDDDLSFTPRGSVGLADFDFENGERLNFTNWNHYFHCNPFTVAFWVYPYEDENFNERNIFLGSYSGSGSSFNIEKTAGKKLRIYYNANPDWIVSAADLPDNTLTHVAITRDSNNYIYCYINGELKATSTDSNWSRVYEVDKTQYGIGGDFRSNWGTVSLQGSINDFRIYATCLTAADIKDLYSISARIMADGSIEAIEFIEDDDLTIDKTHLVKTTGTFAEGNDKVNIKTPDVLTGGSSIGVREIIEI